MEIKTLLPTLALIILCLWLVVLTIKAFINKKMGKGVILLGTTILLGALTTYIGFVNMLSYEWEMPSLSQEEFIKIYENHTGIKIPSDSTKIKSYRSRRDFHGDWHGMLKFKYKNPDYFNQLQSKYNTTYKKLEISQERIAPRFSEGNNYGRYDMPRGSYASVDGLYTIGIDPNSQTVYFYYASW